MQNLEQPTTKKELRSVLRLFNHRDYVPHLAELALPLTKLTAKRVANHIPWDANAEAAFNDAKGKLAEAPKLATPNMAKKVHADDGCV